MRTNLQILPGIKFIGWIDCLKLPKRVDLSAICGMKVSILTEVNQIEFFDDPTCECKTRKDGGGYEDTASLSFVTAKPLPLNSHLGFIVTDVNNNSWLIGAQEAPFPVIECKHQLGTPAGDVAGYAVEVSHVSIKALVPCIF